MAFPYVKIGPWNEDAAPALSPANMTLIDDGIYDAQKFGIIFDSILSGAAASFDITSISANWSHLRLLMYARGSNASNNVGVKVRFNNDSAANYSDMALNTSGSTVAAGESLGATSGEIGQMTGNTAPGGEFATLVAFISHYTSTAGTKTWTSESSSRETTITGGLRNRRVSGVWFAAAAAINRVTLLPSTGNFVTGTRCTLYGLGRP